MNLLTSSTKVSLPFISPCSIGARFRYTYSLYRENKNTPNAMHYPISIDSDAKVH